MKTCNPEITNAVQSVFSDAQLISNLGINLMTVEPGRCDADLELTPDHLQHLGVVHGGVVTTLAGHAALGAAMSIAESSGPPLVTPNFNMNLLRSARAGRLVAEARVVAGGVTLIVVDVEVLNPDAGSRKLVAKATFTFTRSLFAPAKK